MLFQRKPDAEVKQLSTEVGVLTRQVAVLTAQVEKIADDLRRFKGSYYKDRYNDSDEDEEDETPKKKQINIKTFNPFG